MKRLFLLLFFVLLISSCAALERAQKEDIASKQTVPNKAGNASLSGAGRLCIKVPNAKAAMLPDRVYLEAGDWLTGSCKDGKVAWVMPDVWAGKTVQVLVGDYPNEKWESVIIPEIDAAEPAPTNKGAPGARQTVDVTRGSGGGAGYRYLSGWYFTVFPAAKSK